MKTIVFWLMIWCTPSMLYLAFVVPAEAQQPVPLCQQILNEANGRLIAISDGADKKIANLQKQVDDLKAKYEPKRDDAK